MQKHGGKWGADPTFVAGRVLHGLYKPTAPHPSIHSSSPSLSTISGDEFLLDKNKTSTKVIAILGENCITI